MVKGTTLRAVVMKYIVRKHVKERHFSYARMQLDGYFTLRRERKGMAHFLSS